MAFDVPDMTFAHCVNAFTKAVTVDSEAAAAFLQPAIDKAGYQAAVGSN